MAEADTLYRVVMLYIEEHFRFHKSDGFMGSKVGHRSLYPIHSQDYNRTWKFEIKHLTETSMISKG